MHWEILDKKRQKLLKDLTETISLENYYMFGGTALSLQMGLRQSFDFDFCVTEMFNNEILLKELKSIGEIEIKQNQQGTCDVILNGIQVSFFYFPNKLLKPFVMTESIPKLKIASILDIATMKLVALGGRGAKKDFFDLYNILQIENFSTEEMVHALIQKYGKNINYVNVIMGLSYFEDAETEILPKTFVEYDWEKIKKFFLNYQKNFENEFKD